MLLFSIFRLLLHIFLDAVSPTTGTSVLHHNITFFSPGVPQERMPFFCYPPHFPEQPGPVLLNPVREP